jgi:hypothetical protein
MVAHDGASVPRECQAFGFDHVKFEILLNHPKGDFE